MGRPKKGPPLIRSDYFTEESDLTVDELRAISISTLADIPTFLTAVNWNGGAYAVIALRLSPDNQRVLSGTCALVGNLFADKVINCNLFWQPVIATKLTLSIPSLNIFNFPDGKLVSDYLPSSAFPHEFSHNDAVITEDDYPATGISSFVLRAFVSPSTDAFVKIIILLYPCSEETLLALRKHFFPSTHSTKIHGSQDLNYVVLISLSDLLALLVLSEDSGGSLFSQLLSLGPPGPTRVPCLPVLRYATPCPQYLVLL